MKFSLFLAALALILSAHSQPTKEQIRAAIEKIERKEHSKNGEKVISVNVVILSYAVIPLRNWWKDLMDAHLSFGREMDSLNLEVNEDAIKEGVDSTERKKMEEMLQALKDSMAKNASDTSHFDYVAYFRKKYEQTPPSLKVYEVKYKLDVQTNTGGYGRDYLRRVLHLKDLSNAGVQ